MGWIKRNLFFVAGGVLALVLLGAAGFFIYKGWSRNSEARDQLNEIYGKLQQMAQSPLQPGNQKINNAQIARDQEKQLREWHDTAGKYFESIPAIPPEANVRGEAFTAALRRTIDTLQHEADRASVTLPPKYDFSFTAQRALLKFAPGSLDALAAQLGDVKAISEIMFVAKVNDLDSIQRVRVSEDDAQGTASDYTGESPVTNDLAILMPYVVTFRTFTPELAKVITGFANSPHPFIVKSIIVQPAGASATSAPDDGMQNNRYSPEENILLQRRRYRGRGEGEYPPPYGVPPPQQSQLISSKGGLQTVLKEQLLRVTLEVEIAKLLPKS